ncbi:MAG: PspC domain-containing protein [Nocardioides sp.]
MSSRAPTRARRLVRRSDNTVIGGVCAGIADYLGIDPMVVRIAALVGAVLGLGTLVVAYLVLWAVLPLD